MCENEKEVARVRRGLGCEDGECQRSVDEGSKMKGLRHALSASSRSCCELYSAV